MLYASNVCTCIYSNNSSIKNRKIQSARKIYLSFFCFQNRGCNLGSLTQGKKTDSKSYQCGLLLDCQSLIPVPLSKSVWWTTGPSHTSPPPFSGGVPGVSALFVSSGTAGAVPSGASTPVSDLLSDLLSDLSNSTYGAFGFISLKSCQAPDPPFLGVFLDSAWYIRLLGVFCEEVPLRFEFEANMLVSLGTKLRMNCGRMGREPQTTPLVISATLYAGGRELVRWE